MKLIKLRRAIVYSSQAVYGINTETVDGFRKSNTFYF